MRVALTIYAAIYVFVIIVTIDADLKSKKALWETASDAVLLPLGLVGLVLYGFDVANPDLKLVWRLLAPLIIVGQITTNLFGHYLTKKRIIIERHEVWFADIVTVVLSARGFSDLIESGDFIARISAQDKTIITAVLPIGAAAVIANRRRA